MGTRRTEVFTLRHSPNLPNATRATTVVGMPLLDARVETDVEVGPAEELLETERRRDAAELGPEVSRSAWAEAARDVLLTTAGKYQSVVTQKQLAAHVQSRSGIDTQQQIRHWIGDVVRRVADDCVVRDEPLLSALCVDEMGSVGEGYAPAVVASGRENPADPDEHAARERLACYRHFEAANLPADGGLPALVPKLAAARTRLRKTSFAERVVPTCPKCHLQLAATGACDNCD